MRRHAKAIVGLVLLVSLALGAANASAAPPSATIEAPTGVSYNTAQVKGTVTAGDEFEIPTSYGFQYAEMPGEEWKFNNGSYQGSFPPGSGTHEVTGELTGLKPGVEYKTRLVASNFLAFAISPEPNPTFTTLAIADDPLVATLPATEVAYTKAHLAGTIDPEDSPVPLPWHFEYSQNPEAEGWTSVPGGSIPANSGSAPIEVETDLGGLSQGTEYHFRLVASNGNQFISPEPNLTFTTAILDPVPTPAVSVDSVTAITDNSAHFIGTINPEAPLDDPLLKVDWHFECTPACPEAGSGTLPGDGSDHVVTGDATGLEPNRDYEVRLVAENFATSSTASTTFKTGALGPIVGKALPGGVIDATSAWMGALVNPRNSATTYYVEYSTDPGFGSATSDPVSEDASAGSGNELVMANRHVEGLTPDTTYYYRVIASNASGTVTGDPESFKTRATPIPVQGPGLPEGRVYEKVSPAEKNGADVSPGNANGPFGIFGWAATRAATAGDAVLYASKIHFSGEGGSTVNSYLARRTAQGWVTKGITPRMASEPTETAANATFLPWISNDFSHWLVTTPAALNPGDPTREHNHYMYDETTNTYESIPYPPGESPGFIEDSLIGISKDERHPIIIGSETNGTVGLWEWDGSQTKRVDVLPEGMPSHKTADLGAGNFSIPGSNAVSADGSSVFFTTREVGGLYVRQFDGESATTVQVSASERTGDNPLAPTGGKFKLASPDGSVAFFTSEGRLTDESEITPNKFGEFDSATLYRWDANAPVGERLTDIASPGSGGRPGVLGTAGANEDATVVYFTATGKLTPEATEGMANLYEWREDTGELEFVAGLRAPPPFEGGAAGDKPAWTDEEGRQARVSPDGRYLSFISRESLTAYDVNHTRQLYLFDNQTELLSCVSCSTVEPHSRRSTWISTRAMSTEEEGERVGASGTTFGFLSENMSSDGSRIIFDSRDALVPGDSNGKLDIYMWRDGALSLISTGDNGNPTPLLDHSADGKDIFFATLERLVPSDVDTSWDIYDARVGGIAEQVQRAPCVGDECQGTPSPLPTFVTPNSAAYKGAGNVSSQRVTCAKAKVRRNGKCVAKQKSKKAKKAKKKAAKKARQARNGRNG